MRLITTIFSITPGQTDRLVKVYNDFGNGEYVCKLYISGKHHEPADYHTDDKQDAIDTAKLMIEEK